jgi:hypothetical protein
MKHTVELPENPARCECHQCTQARLPQWERQMAEFRQGPQPPLIFFDPTKGVLPQMTIDAAVTKERKRCAKIARMAGAAAEGEERSYMRATGELIACKIECGE